MASSAFRAAAWTPSCRTSTNDIDPIPALSDRDGLVQPTTVTCGALSTGPAQNGEGRVNSQTAKEAAL